jgi:hypothetical protein
MKHLHHIVPVHMGGTNEPSNLVECSVEEHAELHLSLYLSHGRKEDWLAFRALSGQIETQDIQIEKSRLGAYHPNVNTPEAHAKQAAKLRGRKQSATHLQNKIKAATLQRKLTDEDLKVARIMRAKGSTLQVIATKFNTTPITIWRYMKNKVRGAN